MEREQEGVWGIEQSQLRIGMHGDTAEDMRVPQRKLTVFDASNRVTLPNKVLIQEVSPKYSPLFRRPGEKFPVKEKGKE
jgi:hypothetical protein